MDHVRASSSAISNEFVSIPEVEDKEGIVPILFLPIIELTFLHATLGSEVTSIEAVKLYQLSLLDCFMVLLLSAFFFLKSSMYSCVGCRWNFFQAIYFSLSRVRIC